jgi:solute carrier family 25 (adenine nucleotide translocator) protein 4/5/6/31
MFAQAITNLSSFFAYPMDTVRRRLMMTSGQINPKYTGTLDCITKISKQEGWKGFHKAFFKRTGTTNFDQQCRG